MSRSVVLFGFAFALLAQSSAAKDCRITSIQQTPLSDLGVGLYLGQFQGGLYADGSNVMPARHAAEGLSRSRYLQPLDGEGIPSASGKIVLLSIGMSNTTQEFCSRDTNLPCDDWTFMGQAAVHPLVNHSTLEIVNGARGGQAADAWVDPYVLEQNNYDRIRRDKLTPRGLAEKQVQVAWVKVANRQPTVSLASNPNSDADAYILVAQLGQIARALKTRYPNLAIVFFSSRIYAGYADVTLNPEPYAYESGFAVKWLVDAQIRQMAGLGVDARAGDLDFRSVAPWIAWGPYLWADGTTPRSDGLMWSCGDLDVDGTHPARSGEDKVGTMLLDFMLSSPFAAPWFRSDGSCGTSVTADQDHDCDVDQSDFGVFQACMSGPSVRQDDPNCQDALLDADGDVDLNDFGIFQRCMSGANIPAEPSCED